MKTINPDIWVVQYNDGKADVWNKKMPPPASPYSDTFMANEILKEVQNNYASLQNSIEELKACIEWLLECENTYDWLSCAFVNPDEKTTECYELETLYFCARKAVEELIAVSETLSEQTADHKFCNAVCNDDGTLRNFTLRIDGKIFRCECGCNVFHKPDRNDVNLYKCNGCGQEFNGE